MSVLQFDGSTRKSRSGSLGNPSIEKIPIKVEFWEPANHDFLNSPTVEHDYEPDGLTFMASAPF